MKTRSLILVALVLVTLVACGGRNDKPSDADIQATVQAALAATSTAQASSANTVQSAVNATLTAVAPSNGTVAAPFPTTAPLPPTATPVNTTTLTEEQLTTLIDQAVNKAVAAANATSSATTAATQDNTVTTTEASTMTYYVEVSSQQADEALALINQYYATYSDVSQQTLAQLQAIEQDLNGIEHNTAEMEQSLQEINQTLQQGLQLAQSTIDQLETAAHNAQTKANDAKTQAETWSKNVQNEINTRSQNALNVPPNVIANTPQDAAKQVRGYVDMARGAVNKGKLSQQDLNALAQQGANAKAALEKFGGANSEQTSAGIDKLTGYLAKGDMPQARQEFGNLERSAQTVQFNATPGGGKGGNGAQVGGGNARPTVKPRKP